MTDCKYVVWSFRAGMPDLAIESCVLHRLSNDGIVTSTVYNGYHGV